MTDITYIRTQEGFAYLAVVIDLFSRRVVGWSMQSRQTAEVVSQALHLLVDCDAINCQATHGRLAGQAKGQGADPL
ncbi:MAG: hypothetical protein ACJAVR_003929 [Paracoccaceae bacterium]